MALPLIPLAMQGIWAGARAAAPYVAQGARWAAPRIYHGGKVAGRTIWDGAKAAGRKLLGKPNAQPRHVGRDGRWYSRQQTADQYASGVSRGNSIRDVGF